MAKKTQKQRVLRALGREGESGYCGHWFVYSQHPGIPRYGARIHELRQEGWNIETVRCDLPGHDTMETHDKYVLHTHLLYVPGRNDHDETTP